MNQNLKEKIKFLVQEKLKYLASIKAKVNPEKVTEEVFAEIANLSFEERMRMNVDWKPNDDVHQLKFFSTKLIILKAVVANLHKKVSSIISSTINKIDKKIKEIKDETSEAKSFLNNNVENSYEDD